MESKKKSKFALLLLTIATLLWFYPLVLNPTQTLYSPWSDLWAEHIPAKHFLVESFQETGELPRWCPYLYSGSPLLHDIQVGAFYPLHWPMLMLSKDCVGPYLSWLIVFHVWLAGVGMFLTARRQSISHWSALIAALGYMFAGRWMMHLLGGGHYITIGLAWLPLLLICFENALERNALFWTTLNGIVYALIILCTHIQWTFYIGLFLAAWTYDPHRIRRWIGCGVGTLLIALALSMVQLWPTFIASQQSLRSVGMAPESIGDSLRVWSSLIGPEPLAFPHDVRWEKRGGLPLLWLLTGVFAPILSRGRVRYQGMVALGLLLFAGGVGFLLKELPGFNLFRQHARMMLIFAFPLALFTAHTLDVWNQFLALRFTRRMWIGIGSVMLTIYGLTTWILARGYLPIRFHPYMVVAPVLFLTSLVILLNTKKWSHFVLLLVVDVVALREPEVYQVRRTEDIFAPSNCVGFLRDQGKEGRILDEYVFDSETGLWLGSPLGQGTPLAPLNHLEAVRGYNPLDKRWYRQYLQWISDEDRQLQGLDGSLAHPVIGSFELKNRTLLDLLHVRYLLLPKDQRPPGDNWKAVFEDPAPIAFNIYLGGLIKFPRYVVYENEQILPRAFIVPQAKTLPTDNVMKALKETDFRQTVLIDNYQGNTESKGVFREAEIVHFSPNRIELRANSPTAGFLVLSEMWYPGWKCLIDGQSIPIHRANVTFRAVEFPAGEHRVTFTFEPRSYLIGRWISISTIIAGLLILTLTRRNH